MGYSIRRSEQNGGPLRVRDFASTPPADSVGKGLLNHFLGRVRAAGATGLIGLAIVALLALAAVFAPLLLKSDPTAVSHVSLAPPSSAHWFGTDAFGRDVFSRVVYGGRPTLAVAILSIALAGAIGSLLGLVAGYMGLAVDAAIMRTMDVLLAFPGLLLALALVAALGPGLLNLIIAIGISHVPMFARVAYGLTLSAKRQGYVDAARIVGCSEGRILGLHIAPNILSELTVLATSMVGWAILIAATLDFLGFGVQPPTPDWGADLEVGRRWLGVAWWLSVFPGLAITIATLGMNLVGDLVAALLDVKRVNGLKPVSQSLPTSPAASVPTQVAS